MAAVAEKTKTTAAAEMPKLPEIAPEGVQVNEASFAWRTILVRCPAGMVQDDLRNPKIWKRVQASRAQALIKLDHLLILAHDESWMARAIVTEATGTLAHLMIEKVSSFKEVGTGLFSDGTLEIFWDGSAYGVRRVADGVRVISEGFSREDVAVAALRNWYPKTKAA